jgi:hypothetical protein
MPYDKSLDRYQVPSSNGGPGGRADALTPNDSGEFVAYYSALYVGTSGDLAVTPMRNTADTSVIFKNVPVGWFPVSVRKVWSTGTTASQIIGVRD